MDFSVYEALLQLPELRITKVKIGIESINISCKKRAKKNDTTPEMSGHKAKKRLEQQ
jgi:hypothetical protein